MAARPSPLLASPVREVAARLAGNYLGVAARGLARLDDPADLVLEVAGDQRVMEAGPFGNVASRSSLACRKALLTLPPLDLP
jgi:hypothetical protein